MSDPFSVFFEDQHLIVLSKNPGLLSQGEITGDVNLVDLLRARFKRNYVGLVHRLDRNTSGLMVVAKRSKSAERLSDQLRTGTLIRHYHAILLGTILEGSVQTWNHFLLKNEKTNETKSVKEGTPGAKNAVLKVHALKNFIHPLFNSVFNSVMNGEKHTKTCPLTWVRFELETGRSHQIRAQSAAMQHPLIGDAKYGGSAALAATFGVAPSQLFHRPALHSSFLAFLHPMDKKPLEFAEPYAQDIKSAFFAHLE